MLRWCVFVFALAVARAAVLQKVGDFAPARSTEFKRTPRVESLDSYEFRAEAFEGASSAPAKRSLEGWDGHYQNRPEVSNLDSRVIKRSLRPSGIVKRRPVRSFGVMENAGLGALNAAVSTFSNTITSANVASGQVAGASQYRPGYQRPGYPRPGYQGYPRPGYQGYQEGYQGYDYDLPYEGYTYPGNRGGAVRGTNLNNNVNNIKIVSAH